MNSLQQLQNRIGQFQDKNFPGQPVTAKLEGARREIGELLDAPNDLHEWADVLIYFLGAAKVGGISTDVLISAANDKMDINENRKWGEADADGVFHHL